MPRTLASALALSVALSPAALFAQAPAPGVNFFQDPELNGLVDPSIVGSSLPFEFGTADTTGSGPSSALLVTDFVMGPGSPHGLLSLGRSTGCPGQPRIIPQIVELRFDVALTVIQPTTEIWGIAPQAGESVLSEKTLPTDGSPRSCVALSDPYNGCAFALELRGPQLGDSFSVALDNIVVRPYRRPALGTLSTRTAGERATLRVEGEGFLFLFAAFGALETPFVFPEGTINGAIWLDGTLRQVGSLLPTATTGFELNLPDLPAVVGVDLLFQAVQVDPIGLELPQIGHPIREVILAGTAPTLEEDLAVSGR